IATIKGLPQLQQIGVAAELDAQLSPHHAAATIAANKTMRSKLRYRVAHFYLRTHACGILLDSDELAAIAHVDRRQSLSNRLEQRFERVLGNQLVWLARQRAVGTGSNLGLRLRHRRIWQMKQRRLDQRRDDKDIHRHIARKAGVADFLHDA